MFGLNGLNRDNAKIELERIEFIISSLENENPDSIELPKLYAKRLILWAFIGGNDNDV